jgi:hypothetical protein
MNSDDLLINFFLGYSTDSQGRSIQDILSFSEADLEDNHDFIQWIFPTIEHSQYNFNAPVISENFKLLLKKNTTAQRNFCKTCQLFQNFIGIECKTRVGSLLLNKQKRMFFDRPSHNLLRITRVLNSLNQVGKKNCSKKLFNQLEKIIIANPNKISPKSIEFWKTTQISN